MKILSKLLTLLSLTMLVASSTDLHAQRLTLDGNADATLSNGSGIIQIGDDTFTNVVIDGNEILARSNGNNSTLFLNLEGGNVQAGQPTKPTNLWATGFLRAGGTANNPLFQLHHETGVINQIGGSPTVNLSLPAGINSTDIIMVQLTREGGVGNLIPVEIATYTSISIIANTFIPDGATYHVTLIYTD